MGCWLRQVQHCLRGREVGVQAFDRYRDKKNSCRWSLIKMPPTPPLRETQVHKTAISRLPEMSSGEKCWSARRMPPPLCLLLLSGATATAALPLEGGLAGQDSRVSSVPGPQASPLSGWLVPWPLWPGDRQRLQGRVAVDRRQG